MISGASEEELIEAIGRTDVLLEFMSKIKKLQQENKQLKDNWNKLKSWTDYMRTNTLQQNNYGRILDKMQELEQGNDE